LIYSARVSADCGKSDTPAGDAYGDSPGFTDTASGSACTTDSTCITVAAITTGAPAAAQVGVRVHLRACADNVGHNVTFGHCDGDVTGIAGRASRSSVTAFASGPEAACLTVAAITTVTSAPAYSLYENVVEDHARAAAWFADNNSAGIATHRSRTTGATTAALRAGATIATKATRTAVIAAQGLDISAHINGGRSPL
jgi:hypothetical protein